jgi:hypothetical protein
MIGRSRFLLIFGIACGAAVAAQTPVRDNTRVAAGTASISGTVVVNEAAKQPARRVRVTLTNVAGTPPGQTTTTDDSGAFTFRGLPAGRYELQAFKNAFLRSSFGAARPDRAGTPVVVKDGEAVTNLAMGIARGGVITGVVRDIGGRPLPGLAVRVLKLGYNAVTGERTLSAPSTGSVGVGLTDDRGEYRAYGLPPGGYLVVAQPPGPSGRGNEDIRQLTSAEVRQALTAARAGASAPQGKPGQPSLPQSSSSGVGRLNYAPVFHPAATDIGAALPIALGLSEERTGVDVTIQLVPTATISGTVSSASGTPPPSLSVRLVPAGPQTELLAGAGLRGRSTTLLADGRYVFTGVAPGAYSVKAIIGAGGGRGGTPISNTPTQWAAADVMVNGQDLDVPLMLQPGVAINGRVVFEGSQPTAADLQTLAFALVPPGAAGQVLFSGGGRVDAAGRFTFAGVVPDTYRFVTTWSAPAAREKWSIKASTANGREAFEAPLRVNANETVEWTITYTDKPTSLTGVFQDRGGRAATEYYILVFSTDRRHWTPGSRRIRMTRPATDGAFSVKGLPPGEYFLVALADLESGEWNDPTLLEELVKSSAKVTLRDSEETKQDFRIGATP